MSRSLEALSFTRCGEVLDGAGASALGTRNLVPVLATPSTVQAIPGLAEASAPHT